jgi:hypothetical protein
MSSTHNSNNKGFKKAALDDLKRKRELIAKDQKKEECVIEEPHDSSPKKSKPEPVPESLPMDGKDLCKMFSSQFEACIATAMKMHLKDLNKYDISKMQKDLNATVSSFIAGITTVKNEKLAEAEKKKEEYTSNYHRQLEELGIEIEICSVCLNKYVL